MGRIAFDFSLVRRLCGERPVRARSALGASQPARKANQSTVRRRPSGRLTCGCQPRSRAAAVRAAELWRMSPARGAVCSGSTSTPRIAPSSSRSSSRGEAPALAAVAVHDGAGAGAQRRGEQRDDGGVGGVGPLAGAVDVEIAQRHRLEAEELTPHPAVGLAGQLGHGVGRAGDERGGFRRRQLLGPAVDTARRRRHHPPHAGVLRRLEDEEGAVGVGQIGGQWVLHRLQHRPVGRLMKDHVDTGHGRPHRRFVADVALEQIGVFRDVVPEAGREVVEHPDLGAPGEESVGQVRSDEPRSAGDEGPHGRSPYSGVSAASPLARRGRTGANREEAPAGGYGHRLWTSSSGS